MVLSIMLEAMPTMPIRKAPISFTLYGGKKPFLRRLIVYIDRKHRIADLRCALLKSRGAVSKFPMGRHRVETQGIQNGINACPCVFRTG